MAFETSRGVSRETGNIARAPTFKFSGAFLAEQNLQKQKVSSI